MYSMIPYRRTNHLLARPMNDFIRSFFDVNDIFSTPAFHVDVREDENAYVLEAELPGVPKDKIHLSVDDNTLTLSADLNEEKKESHDGYLHCERRTGHVERHFNMDEIDTSALSANYTDGVLRITLPKQKAQDKPTARNIEIE